MFRYCDAHKDVVWWQSEEVIVPYRSPIDGKIHRYFPDVVLKKADGQVLMIEIKPKYQCSPPKRQDNSFTKRGKPTKRFLNEVKTWGINEAKWKAAKEYCADRGWAFRIFHEDHLGINNK